MSLSIRNVALTVSVAGFTCIASTCGMKKTLATYSPLNQVSQIEVVTMLASDEMEGREIGTEGADQAASYIRDQMISAGLKAKGDDNTYYQNFSFKPIKITPHGNMENMSLGTNEVKEIQGKNVMGFIDNRAENTIVIGAHYDHLGYGNDFSLFKGDSVIHNGADDNASGVAAMLSLASGIKNYQHLYQKYNFMFIAFSGEEYGLIGSSYFCDNPTLDLTKVNCMLNFDMVGRLKEDKSLAVYGNGTSPSWTSIVENSNQNAFKIVYDESGVGPSDHTSFYFEDIPVLHFFTGQHEDYHKPSDDISKINFEGLSMVTDFVNRIILQISQKDKLEFTKTKEPSKDDMSFNVTLGVVPDYMYTDYGMRIDGVTEGRPASNSGMEKGDIVIKIGETDVSDMMSYMECLGKYKAGDHTIVKVKRGEDELEMEVTWD